MHRGQEQRGGESKRGHGRAFDVTGTLGAVGGPENVAVLQQWALNLVRGDTETKGSMQTQRKKAGWDDNYLVNLLTRTNY